MKLFSCQSCGQVLHFDNRQCVRCGHRLGYVPESCTLTSLEPDGDVWQAASDGARYRFCVNAEHDGCNWLIPADEDAAFCRACAHNRTIPDLDVQGNLENWQKVERAKHHLFYSLLRLNLPLATRQEDPATGLAFDFLADPPDGNPHGAVMTGHDDGVITINLAEADDAVREQRRVSMGEPYRTLLGHFRHEIGHYFWDRLIANSDQLASFRDCFGDETADYEAALQVHYAQGAPADWPDRFVSAYASCHPWEDFAETWAHYLHIVDTLEMAGAHGLHVQHTNSDGTTDVAADRFDPHSEGTIEQLIDVWLPITIAVNSLNRCLGQPDFYPFVLSDAVIGKLGFIHDLVRRNAQASDAQLSVAAQ